MRRKTLVVMAMLALLAMLTSNVAAQESPTQAENHSINSQSTQSPAIVLAKTVGTVPGVCAATSTITMPAGATVYYCYQATNTGDVPLDVHDLVDSELGVLLDEEVTTLAPGATSPPLLVAETVAITTTNVATWTAATALPSYVIDDSAPYSYVSINATGTPLNLSDDDAAVVTMPFDFLFYGAPSDMLKIGNNGIVKFGTPTGLLLAGNIPWPWTIAGPTISPFWDDIDSDTGNVYVETQGAAPNRSFIVEWYNRPHYPNTGSATFEMILYEGSNEILFQYADVDFGSASWNFGASATVGLNRDGLLAAQYSYNQPVISSETAIHFTPTPVTIVAATAAAQVNVLAPAIAVAPLTLSSTQDTGVVTTLPLTVGNTGVGNLMWEIGEANPAAGSGQQRRPDGLTTLTHSLSQEIVAGNMFWCGSTYVHWDMSALRVFDLAAFGITGDFDVREVEFGIQQSMSGSGAGQPATVRLYTKIDPAGSLVYANLAAIGSASATVPDRTLSMFTVPVAATVPAGSVLVVEIFVPSGAGANNSFLIGTNFAGETDPSYGVASGCGYPEPVTYSAGGYPTVHLVLNVIGYTPPAGCTDPAAIGWLSTTPISGTTAPGTTTPVDVTLDSTDLACNTVSTANLCIASNDPHPGPGNHTEVVVVPVELAVECPTGVTISSLSTDTGTSSRPVPASLPSGAFLAAAAMAFAVVYMQRKRIK